MTPDKTFLIGPITQLVDTAALPPRGALHDSQLEILREAGLLIGNGLVAKTGPFKTLLAEAKESGTPVIRLEGDFVALPGFVDSHTHLCFAGSRANDYALRNAGMSYLDIAKAGGGIWDTVTHTRETSAGTLASLTAERAQRHLLEGVTTIEVKSGYGLSVNEELKMLQAIRQADQATTADLVPTCLAAHICPRDFPGGMAEYLDLIRHELLPQLLSSGLSRRLDAFVEEGAFSPEDILPYFHHAKNLGFSLTVHADQFHTGGSAVAVEAGALSADHLEASTAREIAMLAKSQVVSTALPGASLGLGCAFAPARKILDAGGILAIASDWNPGSAPMGDLLAQAAVLGAFEKLSNAEVLAGITCRAAAALGLADRGSFAPGLLADFLLFSTADYREITYQQGKLKPSQVWKRGEMAKKQG